MLLFLCALAQSEAPWRATAQRYAHIISSAHPPAALLQTARDELSPSRYLKLTSVGVKPQ